MIGVELKKRRAFRKFSYRGVDLEKYVVTLPFFPFHSFLWLLAIFLHPYFFLGATFLGIEWRQGRKPGSKEVNIGGSEEGEAGYDSKSGEIRHLCRYIFLKQNSWGNRLLDLTSTDLRKLVHARARRRFDRGLKRKPMGLIKKLRKAKQEAKPNEKPDLVKTHLRDMIVVPEMIGSVIGIYSGKEFNQVEIKPEMVGHYLGEFSIS
jgi:ribosomal protein uS19